LTKVIYEPGVYNITNEAYHAAEGLSRSALWTFKQLPCKYWYQYLSGKYQPEPDKEAYVVGNLTHTLLLEPHEFDDQYFVMPKINRTTKQGKLDYAELLKEAEGKTLVKPEHFELAQAMRDAVLTNDLAVDILENSINEQTIFWRDAETDILCKARPDIANLPLIADLKTCRDASYRGFQRAAMDDGYFLQAAMIYEATRSLGTPYEKFVFICVEKTEPHHVGLYMLDDEALKYGLSLFRKLITKFAECKRTDIWPDYGVQGLRVPAYATMELEND
jgi:exodeoxyribonuclease VIII